MLSKTEDGIESVEHGWSLEGHWYVKIKTGADGIYGSRIVCANEKQARAISEVLQPLVKFQGVPGKRPTCGTCRWWKADVSHYTGLCREANDPERRSMAKNTATTYSCADWVSTG